MMKCCRWVAVVALFAFATSALAQEAQPGTAEERKACEPDVYRLCAMMIPSVNRIVDCLKGSESQFSAACHAVMFPSSGGSDATGPTNGRKRKGGV